MTNPKLFYLLLLLLFSWWMRSNRTNAYKRLCREFNADVHSDYRQKKGDNLGLWTIYNYWTNAEYHPLGKGTVYDSKSYSFTKPTANNFMHIGYIAQDARVSDPWTTFIPDDSNGLINAGVERIKESIRTYCWAIPCSQSQTRTDILGTGTDIIWCTKQFLTNIEDAINIPVDLPSQIIRHQNTLKYARSEVDVVFEIGLYMAPSDTR